MTDIETNVTDMKDYKSAPGLADDDGKALVRELDRLYSATQWDEDERKKIRSGSFQERYAIATLKKALISAALKFKRVPTSGHGLMPIYAITSTASFRSEWARSSMTCNTRYKEGSFTNPASI